MIIDRPQYYPVEFGGVVEGVGTPHSRPLTYTWIDGRDTPVPIVAGEEVWHVGYNPFPSRFPDIVVPGYTDVADLHFWLSQTAPRSVDLTELLTENFVGVWTVQTLDAHYGDYRAKLKTVLDIFLDWESWEEVVTTLDEELENSYTIIADGQSLDAWFLQQLQADKDHVLNVASSMGYDKNALVALLTEWALI